MINVKFKRLHEDALIPAYAKQGDAGMDVCSIDNYELSPSNSILVKTGLAMELPLGYEAQVRPRSGLAYKNQITVLNSPGTIDSGYRNEIGVILINHGKETFNIKKGERIAQLVIAKHETPTIEEVIELAESERGLGGFGSTGK